MGLPRKIILSRGPAKAPHILQGLQNEAVSRLVERGSIVKEKLAASILGPLLAQFCRVCRMVEKGPISFIKKGFRIPFDHLGRPSKGLLLGERLRPKKSGDGKGSIWRLPEKAARKGYPTSAKTHGLEGRPPLPHSLRAQSVYACM